VDWRAHSLAVQISICARVMFAAMELSQIRSQWNQVLDVLEAKNRIAWLAYFDARLSSYDNGVLTLDFSDSRKFATSHEYQQTRPNLKSDLLSAIEDVLKIKVELIEK
jgi:hypothetical protein